MQSISLFLDITKSADFWWKNADVSKAQSKPNLQNLNLQLNEYLQSEIKQKLSSVQKITCITAIALTK